MTSRNWKIVLVTVLVGVAGLLIYRFSAVRANKLAHQTLTRILNSTEGDHLTRIDSVEWYLESNYEVTSALPAAYWALLHAHSEAMTDSQAIYDVAQRYLKADTSSTSHYAIAQAFSERGVFLSDALIHARRGIVGINSAPVPENMGEEDWQRMRDDISGQMSHTVATIFLRTGRPDSAVLELKSLIARFPYRAKYQVTLAKVYEKSNRMEYAVASYLRASALEPDNSETVQALHRLYTPEFGNGASLKGRMDREIEDLKDGRKADMADRMLDVPAKPLLIYDISGNPYRLVDFRGKTVVLDFWAAWVPPCIAELNQFQASYDRLKSREDVVLLAVNVDADTSGVRAFMAEHGFSFPLYFKGDDTVSDFAITGVPTRTVIGADGRVKFRHVGHERVGDYHDELMWQLELAGTTVY